MIGVIKSTSLWHKIDLAAEARLCVTDLNVKRLHIGHIYRCPSPLQGESPKPHKLFSALNFSHASFNVANTAALIIFCSVVAVVGSYHLLSA